ncbi:MAG: sensor histidine kinase [Nitrospira sp.]|nr:sensor histidine kinase [Nitrospira sp.]
MLLNLVENAMKYSNPGGKVEISLLRDGQEVRLSVTDHGIGIAPADQKKIFSTVFPHGCGSRPYQEGNRAWSCHLRLDRRSS